MRISRRATRASTTMGVFFAEGASQFDYCYQRTPLIAKKYVEADAQLKGPLIDYISSCGSCVPASLRS